MIKKEHHSLWVEKYRPDEKINYNSGGNINV